MPNCRPSSRPWNPCRSWRIEHGRQLLGLLGSHRGVEPETRKTGSAASLSTVRVFGDREYPDDQVPDELDPCEADWIGCRAYRDVPDCAEYVKDVGMERPADSSIPLTTTTTRRMAGGGTCGCTRGSRATWMGQPIWSRSFSKSSGPTSAGRSPTPPPARNPA